MKITCNALLDAFHQVRMKMFGWCRWLGKTPAVDHDLLTTTPLPAGLLPYEGTLAGIPQVHTHALCGASTLIDEQTARLYLAHPLLMDDQVYCAGCHEHFHCSEFTWESTGENMLDYFGRLRREYMRRVYHLRLTDRPVGVIVLPEAAKELRRQAKALKWPKYYLSLKIMLDGSFAAELVDVRHRVTETIIDAAIPIIIERDQISQMQGIVVDHCPNRGSLNIVVTRLHR